MRAGQALRERSLTPIRPHVRTDHAALGADCPAVQIQQYGFVGPAIGIDDRVVVAVEALIAIDQQVPDAMRADMPERDRRAAVSSWSSLRGRVVVRITVTHGRIVTSLGMSSISVDNCPEGSVYRIHL
jgi:hypothetical protein